MRYLRRIFAPSMLLILALGPLAACAPTRFEDQAGEVKPPEATRPPDLAAGPVTRITHADVVNTGFGEADQVDGGQTPALGPG